MLKKVSEQETNKSAKRQPDKARAVQESCRANKYFTGHNAKVQKIKLSGHWSLVNAERSFQAGRSRLFTFNLSLTRKYFVIIRLIIIKI